jgi:regulator of cell morphogenesis and NO signaling
MTITPTSPSLLKMSLAEIVTDDARTAAVFDRLGLDYCCHGQRSLEDAAAAVGLRPSEVVAALAGLAAVDAPAPRAWPDLRELTRHIVERHHAYVRQSRPQISAWLDKLVSRHGARHPELSEVQHTFADLADDLTSHTAKEESVLFPYIDALAHARQAGRPLPAGPFGTVANPIRAMEHDHEDAGELLKRLRELTDNYTPPPDACMTYRLCYQELERFQADLHRHVHLENHVLFPGAIALEDALT